MSQLSSLWAGRIYGTNTGNFFLKFEQISPNLIGNLRFLDTEYGMTLYNVTGSFDESLTLVGTPVTEPEELNLGTLEINANLTSEGHLRGEWTSSIGTGGTFVGYPHSSEDEAQKSEQTMQVPEQFFTHSVDIGAVSLYEPDIVALIADLKKDFTQGKAIVTYSTGAGEITKYADDFLTNKPTNATLSYLKLQIQEHEAHGINKIAVVELRRYGFNEVRAQGISESWTIGRAEVLATRLKHCQNGLVNAYKKFGLNLNQALFLGMLILIPQFTSMKQRAIFVVSVFALLHALLWMHSRLVPNADIRASSPTPSQFARFLPSSVSFLFAVVASVIASYIYGWLISNAP